MSMSSLVAVCICNSTGRSEISRVVVIEDGNEIARGTASGSLLSSLATMSGIYTTILLLPMLS